MIIDEGYCSQAIQLYNKGLNIGISVIRDEEYNLITSFFEKRIDNLFITDINHPDDLNKFD